MARIRSTGKRDQVKYTKKTHGAGAGKVRCHACGIGMAVLKQQSDGTMAYVCERCGRVFKETTL